MWEGQSVTLGTEINSITDPYSMADNLHGSNRNLSIFLRELAVKANKKDIASRGGVQILRLNFRFCYSQFPSLFTMVTHLLKENMDGNIFRYPNRKYVKIQALLI